MTRFHLSPYLLLLLLTGCFSSNRDNLQDPANTPILQLGDVLFDPSTGDVVVSWSYIGQSEISAFRVQRNLASGFSDVGSVVGVTGDRFERRALTFRDTDVPAGERLFYRILVSLDGRNTATEARTVRIPGAQLVSVNPDPVAGRIRVSWRVTGGDVSGVPAVSTVSLFREDSGVESLIFETSDLSVRTYFDLDVLGAETYRYFVRSELPGVTLDSRSEEGGIWPSAGRTQIGGPATVNARSFIYMRSNNSLSVYTHGPTQTTDHTYRIRGFRSSQTLTNNDDQQIRQDRDLIPSTLSVDAPSRTYIISVPGSGGPPIGTSAHVFISGISTETDEVVVLAEASEFFTSTPQRWSLPAGATKTSISAFSTLIYVSVGRELRVFSDDFAPVDVFDLPEEPVAIEAWNTSLWMASGPGGLHHGHVGMSVQIPTGIVWSAVSLPEGAKPVALATNDLGQVFVLDAGLGRVHVLDRDGTNLFHWPLPERSFDNGQIVVTAGNDAFVLDDDGAVHTYVP